MVNMNMPSMLNTWHKGVCMS